jgi:uncharacterized protein (TIGR04255 family)
VIASIATPGFIAPFQEWLRSEYPIMRQEQQMAVVFGLQGPAPQANGFVWRLQQAEPGWSIVLGSDSLAIETANYTSRADFMARWKDALTALESVANPTVYERLGVRYVNRLTGVNATEDLQALVRDEIIGALAIELPERSAIESSATQIHFRLGDLQLQVRWGRVPEGALMVPGITPIPEVSFQLDIDVYSEGMRPFSAEGIASSSISAADHAYRFFRWAVSDEFLSRFGDVQ